jgi:hypothetical protein
MSDSDFSIGGRDFKVRKIDAIKQFHIVRRISPILAELLPAMKGMQESKDQDQMDQIAKFLTPIMDGLSKLSDADSEIVLYGLLNAAEIKMGREIGQK